MSFENDSKIVQGVAKIFPWFFFLVAALVCMTTMTRMVDDQRTLIGTYKALGFSNARIIWKYVSYSGSSALLGTICGFFLGSWLFPQAIWTAYGILYGFADLPYVINWGIGAVALAVALLCSAGATFLRLPQRPEGNACGAHSPPHAKVRQTRASGAGAIYGNTCHFSTR